MNKSPQFVRIALQRRLVSFGFAVKLDENKTRYDYYINPMQFCEYLGISEDELKGGVNGELTRKKRETQGIT